MNGVTVELEMNKPFDLLVKGLDSLDNRGGRIRTDDFLHPKQAL